MSVQAFCRGRGVCFGSFYQWRRRLRRNSKPVRFALIKTRPAAEGAVPLELVFAGGDRLRISSGADAATLRLVPAAIRA